MPTPQPSASDSHLHREVAESFGADAARYDRARPSYPQAMVDQVLAVLPGRDVLDVGCGTGISSRPFAAAGCRVLGLDVDPRMAQVARAAGLEVEVSGFEAWDPAGRTFDAVVAGQTWHWIDPVAGAARAAEVLRPGGVLALFWNAAQLPSELAAALAEVYQRVAPDAMVTRFATATAGVSMADGYQAFLDKAAEGLRTTGGFDEPHRRRFDWQRAYTRDEWLEQLPTQGGHSQLPADTLAQILAGVGAVVDEAGGRFTVHYATVLLTATRTPIR